MHDTMSTPRAPRKSERASIPSTLWYVSFTMCDWYKIHCPEHHCHLCTVSFISSMEIVLQIVVRHLIILLIALLVCRLLLLSHRLICLWKNVASCMHFVQDCVIVKRSSTQPLKRLSALPLTGPIYVYQWFITSLGLVAPCIIRRGMDWKQQGILHITPERYQAQTSNHLLGEWQARRVGLLAAGTNDGMWSWLLRVLCCL